jgi:FkbM family methyltransferase
MLNNFFLLLSFLERVFAYALGKGYGRGSIRQENHLIYKLLGRSAVIAIDVGANIGEYTAELRRIYPDAEIHSFEPSCTNIDLLRSRFLLDYRTFIVPAGLANCAASATLYSDLPGSGLASLTLRDLSHVGRVFSFQEVVQTIRFEDYWTEKLNSRRIDIIKLDIEGHELDALHGIGEAIHQTCIIQFEFGGCNIDTRTYFRDFWIFFNLNNFSLYRMTPFGVDKIVGYRESDEFFSTTNYIATNNEFI